LLDRGRVALIDVLSEHLHDDDQQLHALVQGDVPLVDLGELSQVIHLGIGSYEDVFDYLVVGVLDCPSELSHIALELVVALLQLFKHEVKTVSCNGRVVLLYTIAHVEVASEDHLLHTHLGVVGLAQVDALDVVEELVV
jgi:hypothetical protein